MQVAKGLMDEVLRPVSLKGRAFQATLLQTAHMGLAMPLRLLSNLALVQFLMPEAFGVMAVLTLLHMCLNLLSDVGLRESVIRERDGESARFLRIVWTARAIRSIVLTLATLLIALAFALTQEKIASAESIYAHPDLPGLIAASAPVFLIEGLGSANNLLAARRFRYRQTVNLALISQIAGIAAMVALAAATHSVWALLSGMIVGGAVSAALSHVLLDGPGMKIVVDRDRMTKLWMFGRWVVASSLFNYLRINSDRIVLSVLVTNSVFSIYAIAVLWIKPFNQALERIVNNVFHPAVGELLRREQSGFESKVRRFFYAILGLSIVFVLFIPALVREVTDLLYPDAYKGISRYIFLIALGAISIPSSCCHSIVMQTGNSRFAGLVNTIAGIASAVAIWISAKTFGIEIAILTFALLSFLRGQIYFCNRTVRNTIGWRANGAWIAAAAALFLAHLSRFAE